MCNIFAEINSTSIVAQSVTCDRRHRKKIDQCGCCSSCLLRRQALAASGIHDETQYVIEQIETPSESHGLHLYAMLSQVAQLQSIFEMKDPWLGLVQRYPRLEDIADEFAAQQQIPPNEIRNKLAHLYKQYVDEWEVALPSINMGVLDRSTLLPVV